LSEALGQERIAPGDLVLFTAFGAGLSRGAALMRWGARVSAVDRSDAELPPCDFTGLELIRDNVTAQRAHHERRTDVE